jgi:hypothetical protein
VVETTDPALLRSVVGDMGVGESVLFSCIPATCGGGGGAMRALDELELLRCGFGALGAVWVSEGRLITSPAIPVCSWFEMWVTVEVDAAEKSKRPYRGRGLLGVVRLASDADADRPRLTAFFSCVTCALSPCTAIDHSGVLSVANPSSADSLRLRLWITSFFGTARVRRGKLVMSSPSFGRGCRSQTLVPPPEDEV